MHSIQNNERQNQFHLLININFAYSSFFLESWYKYIGFFSEINNTVKKIIPRKIQNFEFKILQITKKRKQIRTERLAFMKKKVKEEFGYELKIIHDKDDELDKELLILEKDEAEDQSEIHGKNLSVCY